MDFFTALMKIVNIISAALGSEKAVPSAMFSAGVFQAVAALAFLFAKPPTGIFSHHGEAAVALYYAILVTGVIVGSITGSASFWVLRDPARRHAVGMALLCAATVTLIPGAWLDTWRTRWRDMSSPWNHRGQREPLDPPLRWPHPPCSRGLADSLRAAAAAGLPARPPHRELGPSRLPPRFPPPAPRPRALLSSRHGRRHRPWPRRIDPQFSGLRPRDSYSNINSMVNVKFKEENYLLCITRSDLANGFGFGEGRLVMKFQLATVGFPGPLWKGPNKLAVEKRKEKAMRKIEHLWELVEVTAMEAAIVWRAQAILETLQHDRLDAWLHRVGLAGDIEELKSEIERMETVVNGVKGRAVGNKPLARSLARVKELMYGADDVVDELDYYRIQHQVEGATFAPATVLEVMVGDVDLGGGEQIDASANTGISNNSVRKNRSRERDNFRIVPPVNGQPAQAECIDCGTLVTWGHGTSVLRKHLNSARCKNKRKNKCAATEQTLNPQSDGDGVRNITTISTNDSEARKRMRIEENVVTTHPWNIAEYSKRINEIALELQSIRGNVIEYLKDSVGSSDQHHSNTSDTRVRTSSALTGKVYGRDNEKDRIIGVIKGAKSDHITVLPIVGILGVGKTALAKLVYNDPVVERQFERIWVWVSNVFDEVRVTREILDIVTLDSHEGYPRNKYSYEGVSNYSKLQEVLKKHMACWSKKFLLVLDDVSDCMDNSRWNELLYVLGSTQAKGNVIIVTVRNLLVAQRIGTVEPIKLGALQNDDFWLLFKARAFGDDNSRVSRNRPSNSCKVKGQPISSRECRGNVKRPSYYQPLEKHPEGWCLGISTSPWRYHDCFED
ncbi:hypothetical protein U9M48_044775 [Paspalum notatum var. saurae]|uniref:BED-type domain-containing protein n=1 Tax=Paspalum notatum var. saurae TaxID=547442 RepID=A0AAQ3V0E7_PASNO